MKLIRTVINGTMRECRVDDKTAELIAKTLDEMHPRTFGEPFWSFEAEGNRYTVDIL